MRRLHLKIAACLMLGAGVSSCTVTSQITLDYVPTPGRVQPGAPEFGTRQFTDQRGYEANYLGTIRTQIGTPVEEVRTRVPLADVVTNAFGYGLEGRGMLAGQGVSKYVVTGEILEMYCQMLVRPYGYAKVRVSVLDAATGQVIHSRVYEGERQSGAYMPGSGSPIGMLRDLVSGALQDVVDRALDDPEMRGRLGGGGFEATPGGPVGWREPDPGVI